MTSLKDDKSPSRTRDNLLLHGARLLHARGYNATGVQDIVAAAGVPKGSFYHFFKSKEDLGVQTVDFFAAHYQAQADKFLADPAAAPLRRLRGFFESFRLFFESSQCRLGCPVGNLALEMSDRSEALRVRLDRQLSAMKAPIIGCLREAQSRGEIPARPDAVELGDFIINSWEGALLAMKAARSPRPLVLFEEMVFGMLLGNQTTTTHKGERRKSAASTMPHPRARAPSISSPRRTRGRSVRSGPTGTSPSPSTTTAPPGRIS